MLVLTRKLGQSITITTPTGEDITVRLVRITSRKARIAVDAPTRFAIVREELTSEEVISGDDEQEEISDDAGLIDRIRHATGSIDIDPSPTT